MDLAARRHVAIEGPIGVGKTSLARRLAAHLGADLLLEAPQDNPYLERFYGDRRGYAFQAQLAFLFHRAQQVRRLAQPSMFESRVVSDFMIDKDALFARLNLDADEYRLYRPMYEHVATSVPAPDLVIWLRASVPTLRERIARRGIAMERGIDDDYLERLAVAYDELFADYRSAPLLVVEHEGFHPAADDVDLDTLLQSIEAMPEEPGTVRAVGGRGSAI